MKNEKNELRKKKKKPLKFPKMDKKIIIKKVEKTVTFDKKVRKN